MTVTSGHIYHSNEYARVGLFFKLNFYIDTCFKDYKKAIEYFQHYYPGKS